MVVDDLLLLPKQPLVVAEGGLATPAVSGVGANTLWLVPPEHVRAPRLRNRGYGPRTIDDALRDGRCVEQQVDDAGGVKLAARAPVDEVVSEVEKRFAPLLAAGPRARDVDERRSYLLVDAAQLVPGSFVDVRALDVDFLAFSFHKLLAPFGVGVLYGKEHLLAAALPFLYGGDMIAEGRVFPDRVEYNALPWKYAAGTPNILGTVASGEAVRLLLDLASSPGRPTYFGTNLPVERAAVRSAMDRIASWNSQLTFRAMSALGAIPGITIYGPGDADRRTSLIAFNLAGRDPFRIAEALDRAGVEARAGCHCATLAHHALHLNPPASVRLSFYLYNTPDDVDHAVEAVAAIANRTHAVAGR